MNRSESLLIKLDEVSISSVDLSDATYEMYLYAIGQSTKIRESFTINEFKIISAIKSKLKSIKKELIKVSKEIGSNFEKSYLEFMIAFSSPSVYGILKAFGFSFKKIFQSLNLITKLYKKGLESVFKEIFKTKMIQKLRRGVIKIDDLIAKYPIIGQLTGPIVAGLLLYIWLSMTFIGDLEYDFDFSSLVAALSGSFSLEDLFLSPPGLMMSALFATGDMISAPWLGSNLYNLVLALAYTGLVKLYNSDNELAISIREKIQVG